MQYKKQVLAGILIVLTTLFACTSNEIGESRDVNQDRIYMDYEVSYAAGDEEVLLRLQYRFAGPYGTTLVLTDPSQVKLDGQLLKADSSKFGGAYYEIRRDYKNFGGAHRIEFTDINNRRFENSFEFKPVEPPVLPFVVNRTADLQVRYNTGALGPEDYIAISSADTDSSFYYQQKAGAPLVTIPAAELKRQETDAFSLETLVHREIPLSKTTPEGGRLSLNYRLKAVKIKLQ